MQLCLYCGGDEDEPGHRERCDGRQGAIEEPELILRARHSDPETSHAAMAALDEGEMRNAADVVVWLIDQYGAMADYQLRDHFRAVWPRGCYHLYRQARSIARDEGRLRDSGERVVSPESGRKQVVWERCEGPPVAIEKCEACGHVLRRRVGAT